MSNVMFAALENRIKARYPGFSYKFKDEESFMQRIGKAMFFNKDFMTSYTNTFGQTVYFPNRANFDKNPDNYFETLCHEYVHIADDAAHPILFKLKYALPQILALPAVLFILLSPIFIFLMAFSIISSLWLLTLLSVVFLAPIPSPGRTQAELRGYGMSIKIRMWANINDVTPYLNRYLPAFVGSGYYYMCPFKRYVAKELDKYFKTDDCINDKNPAYKDVYNLVQKYETL
ncbi:MAG: hypothetical protein WC516_07105 [Patescibacteria group bacterium]